MSVAEYQTTFAVIP